MKPLETYWAFFIAYALISRALGTAPLSSLLRGASLLMLNLGGVYFVFYRPLAPIPYGFPFLVGVAVIFFLVLALSRRGLWGLAWSYLAPQAAWLVPAALSTIPLAYFSYYLGLSFPENAARSGLIRPAALVGLSYFVMRLMLYGVRHSRGQLPPIGSAPERFLNFLNYVFFLPVFWAGPVSSADHHQVAPRKFSFRSLSDEMLGVERVFWGALKVWFFANLFLTATFDGSMLKPDGFEARWFLSCASYYLFFYCQFSGYCDMVIGLSRIAGYKVDENFLQPLRATRLQDFWKRWHKTVSDAVFYLFYSPIAQLFARRISKPRSRSWALALLIVPTMAIMGVWHGFTLGFLCFGLWHGFFLMLAHLSRDFAFLHRVRDRVPKVVWTMISWLLTQSVVCLSMFFLHKNWLSLFR